MDTAARAPVATLYGHPTGLFTLFFAEMWERFSFYGMRALLVFYMTKGFLGYGDDDAYAVYGAYTALVYMTPFFGGMIADRILGPRRAVILGGVLMALGHLLMGVESKLAFYSALGLLIVGNGFFKPNISSMVGELYPPGSRKRDGGFTLFYMGINLGAAMAPLLCGFVGEKYGWHKGFGLATIGMCVGLAVFVLPTLFAQISIALGALAGAIAMFALERGRVEVMVVNVFTGLCLLASGYFAIRALRVRGLDPSVGSPPNRDALREPAWLGLSRERLVYVGSVLAVPLLALFVSGFLPFSKDGKGISLISEETISGLKKSSNSANQALATILHEVSKPAGLVLLLAGIVALVYLGARTVRLERVPRQRLYVVLILTFFSLLFWSFFEQAGSSLNNFADRNVHRVAGGEPVTAAEVGQIIMIQPTQAQLGYRNGDRIFTMDQLSELRKAAQREGRPDDFTIDWVVAPDNVGMLKATHEQEIPASTFQSVNPVGILIFGLLFTALWSWLGTRRLEPSTPFKFALGLLQLGLGFAAIAYGASTADGRGMVGTVWLVLGYTLHTTGELCLSPVGLSMVTKLSPKILVSTVMGMWFLATAFSQYLAAIISLFTSVTESTAEGGVTIPPPIKTVGDYGRVFQQIAWAALISAGICFLIVPVLKQWMHEDKPDSNSA